VKAELILFSGWPTGHVAHTHPWDCNAKRLSLDSSCYYEGIGFERQVKLRIFNCMYPAVQCTGL